MGSYGRLVRAVGLSAKVLAVVASKVVAGWGRGRGSEPPVQASRAYDGDASSRAVVQPEREITYTLVELLTSTALRINARTEARVTKQLIWDFTRVIGKENLTELEWFIGGAWVSRRSQRSRAGRKSTACRPGACCRELHQRATTLSGLFDSLTEQCAPRPASRSAEAIRAPSI